MKRILFLIVLLGVYVFGTNYIVFAGQINYLPGGKNYLSLENLEYTNDGISLLNSIDKIMVKPNTEYVFSMDPHLITSRTEISIGYYNNSDLYDEINFTGNDMQITSIDSITYAYYSFTIDFDVNYISIVMTELGLDGVAEANVIQIEEGNYPTAYEAHIPGTIIDTTSPYFQSSGTIISYIDRPITADEVMSSLVAYDSIDGDVSSNITILNDGYTANINKIGVYSIIFSVSDNSENTSEVEISIEVVDVLSPIFSDIDEIDVIYPNALSETEVLAMLSASDNYDGDISDLITIDNNEYTMNSNEVGTYPIQFSVSDSSGNTTTHELVVSVLDQEAPIITGEESIHVGYNEYFSETTLRSRLNASDNYDSNIILEIESNPYKDNSKNIGAYDVVFSATDSSGNRTEKIITLNVIDGIAPMIYFDLSVIQVYSDQVMTLPDFAKLLTKTKELDSGKDYLITVKYDSYTKHANIPGTYHLNLLFEDEVGEIINKDLEVKVINQGIDDIFVSPEETEVGFIEKYQNNLIIGGSGIVVIVSNLVWYFIHRKRRI